MTDSSARRSSFVTPARAALLVALTLFSVVAVAGLAAPAAADAPSVDDTSVDPGEALAGTTETHTVVVNATDVNTSGGAATVEVNLTNWPGEVAADVSRSDVTVATAGVELVDDPSATDGVLALSVDDTDTAVVDVDLAVEFAVAHPVDAAGSHYAVDVSVTDAEGDSAVGPSTEVRVVPETLSAGFAAASVDSTGDGARSSLTVDSNRDGTLDARVTARGLDGEDLYALFGGDGRADVQRAGDDAVRLVGVAPGDAVPVDFEAVTAASYGFTVTATDTNATAVATVNVERREIDASFGQDVYEGHAGDFVRFDISLENLDEAYVVVGGDRTPDGDLTNFLDILHVRGGTSVTVNTRLLGTDAPADEVYVSDGSVASYAHSPNDPRFDEVTFTGADGGTVATNLSAFRERLGVDGPPRPLQSGRYRLLVGADGDVVVREDGVPDFERPLARSNLYLRPPEFGNLTVSVAPTASASAVEDPANLGELRGQLTNRTTVAKGDRLVFGFDASGLHGTLSWLAPGADPLAESGVPPSVLARLLALPEGVSIEATQLDPERNERTAKLALGEATDGDAYLLAEPGPDDERAGSAERYYLVVDTRGSGPFDVPVEPDDAVEFELGVRASRSGAYRFDRVDHARKTATDGAVDHFPYFESGADNWTRTRRIDFEEPTVEYDRTDAGGRPVAVNATDATISGWTNVAPASDVSVQVLPENDSDRDPLAVETLDVTENGTFTFEHDLSDRLAGGTVYLEFYVDERFLDGRHVRLVNSSDAFPTFDVVEAPHSTVVRGGESAVVSVPMRNDGTIDGRSRVELRLDGETVVRRSVLVRGNVTTRVGLEVPTDTLEPGTYDYTVVTPADSANGTLVVEAASDPTPAPNGSGESGEPDGGPNGTGGDGTPEDGDAPAGPLGLPVPVGGRHAVVGAVVVGAAHVLDHWL